MFPLRKGNSVMTTSVQMEDYLDKLFNSEPGDRDVYVVDTIKAKKTVDGQTQYLVTWKGYSKNHKAWEPAEHLTEYGAQEIETEYEKSLRQSHSVKMMMQVGH